MHSKNLNFLHALYFRYDSEIHCIAKFLPLCFGSKRHRFVYFPYILGIFGISHILFGYISHLIAFVTLTLDHSSFQPCNFVLGYSFSLFSLFFLSFSWLPNTTFEDDNSRDVWLSLKTLKWRVARLVNGVLQVVLYFK